MNKEQFEQLTHNLDLHHNKCVGNAYTAHPIFLVRVKKIDWGYESEYAQHHAIYHYCEYYHSVEEFWESFDLDDKDEMECFLEGFTNKAAAHRFKVKGKGMDLHSLFDLIDTYMSYHEYQLAHGNERWETINWFLTRDAAESFVKAKFGDVDANVWVDSLYRSGEFSGLLQAIADGKVVWKDEVV